MPPRLPRLGSVANTFDAEFADRYERERARWLRRRFVWYCGIALAILAFSASYNASDLYQQRQQGLSLGPSTSLDFVADLLLTLLHIVALVLVLRHRPQRRFLVDISTAVVLIFASITMVVTPLVMYGDQGEAPGGDLSGEALDFYVGVLGLVGAGLIHCFAAMFVALTFRESLRQFLLLGAAFVGVTLLVNEGTPAVKIWLIGLFPMAGLPGLLWAWLRGRRFDERFRSRMLEGRIGEISMELAYARRVHEALFPPAVASGPIRIEYHYEPMREIGGDFLYVHPLSFPPAPHQAPISVVLIDVSGHGVTAALAVNRLHGELQRFFSQSPDGSPGELLTDLNSYALAALAPHAVYASVLCLRFDPQRQEVQWASAGHTPGLLRRCDGLVEALGATAPLIGVLDADLFDAAPQVLSTAPGDTLVAYTDGLIEARDQAGGEFTLQRLRALVAEEGGESRSADLLRLLIESLRQHRHGPPTDDTLIVQVRISTGTRGQSQVAGDFPAPPA